MLLGSDLGVLLADRLGQFRLHHLAHDDEPGSRGERQQAVLERARHLGQGDGRFQRQASEAIEFVHRRDADDG